MFYITHNTCAVMKSLLKSISHVIFLLSFLANPQFISAQTDVGGAITSNTTWTLSGSPGSPYFVLENVLVSDGVTLVIEAGVTVEFLSATSLQVGGTLLAQGTSGDLITFTSNNSSPSIGDWENILFTDTSTPATYDMNGDYTGGSILDYVVVEYGGGRAAVGGAIQTNFSSPLIRNSTINNSASSGIHVENGAPKIEGNLLSDNITGVSTVGSTSPTILDNTIQNNSSLGISFNSSGTITENLVKNNSGGGISTGGCIGGITISNNISIDNSGWGINVGNSCDGVTVSYNFVISNDGGGIYMNTGNVVTNNTIANNLGRGFSSGHAAPVLTNNAISGNKGDYAVYYAPFSGSRDFKYNTITHHHSTLLVNSSAVFLHAWTGINSGYPLMAYNNIHRNFSTYAVVNGYPVGSLNISAENNWWGTAAEQLIQAKIYDWFDDASLGIINYDPYLTSPDKDAPISPPGNGKKYLGPNVSASAVTSSAAGGDVVLTWDANPESDLAGYKVYYGSPTGYSFANMVDVGSDTFYILTGASITDTIAITAYDTDADGVNDQSEGNESWFVYATVDSIVGIDDEFAGIPEDFELYQNYPNPFNPSTIIKYALPKASNISLVIYNLLGQEIMRWSESNVSPGYHEMRWNGTSQTGSPVSSGIYIYRIVTDDFVQTRKMLLLK